MASLEGLCPECTKPLNHTTRRLSRSSCGHDKCLICCFNSSICQQCQSVDESSAMSFDLGCQRLVTTPATTPSKAPKHDLTPASKLDPLPAQKKHLARRHSIGSDDDITLSSFMDDSGIQTFHTSNVMSSTPKKAVSVNHSGGAIKARTTIIECYLRKHFEECEEGQLKIENMILEIKESDMSEAERKHIQDIGTASVTRIIKRLFPSSKYIKSSKTVHGLQRKLKHIVDNIEMTDCLGIDIQNILIDAQSTKRMTDQNLTKLIHLLQERSKVVNETIETLEKKVAELRLLKTPDDDVLSTGQRLELWRELQKLPGILSFGVRGKKEPTYTIDPNLFSDLTEKVEKECPLIHEMLYGIVVDEDKIGKNVRKTDEVKMCAAIHCLSQLVDIRSQTANNDIPVIFGLTAISYGAGEKFVNLLAKLGLSEYWGTLENHLQRRLKNQDQIIEEFLADYKGPLLFGLDNINIYKGNRSHQRVFNKVTPHMWNFTVRCVIKPDLSKFEYLDLADPRVTCDSQKPIHEVKVEDVLLNSDINKVHRDKVQRAKQDYIMQAMDIAYNIIPDGMPTDEKAFKAWLKEHRIPLEKRDRKKKNKIPIRTAKPKLTDTTTGKKTDVLVLKLSTENSSTKTGMANIVNEFAKEFSLPLKEDQSFLPQNRDMTFAIDDARKRFLFDCELKEHSKQQANLIKTISSQEQNMPGEDPTETHHLSSMREELNKTDEKFNTTFEKLKNLVSDAQRANDIPGLVHYLRQSDKQWDVCDSFKRTLLHKAVEKKALNMIKVLLFKGVNINVKEGCGATPLTLAVISEQSDIVKLLVQSGASIQPEYYIGVPAPVDLAKSLGLNDIIDILTPDPQEDAELYAKFRDMSLHSLNHSPPDVIDQNDVEVSEDNRVYKGDFLFFGDVGVTKVLRSVANTKQDTYGWVTQTPGDLHAGGYMEECAAKAQGPGGLYHAAYSVLGRKKVVPEIYKAEKLKAGNLRLGREANRDVAMGYAIAAALKFRASESFPQKNELEQAQHARKLEDLLFERFSEWAEKLSEEDEAARYYLELVLFFGPVLHLFYQSIRYGDGLAREACWLAFLPIFLQLQKKNYFTDALVFAVNFKANWPLLLRCMLQENSSVNLSGAFGHNIALDEYIESEIVCPLKQYSSTKTTLKVLEMLCSNLQIVRQARKSYTSKGGFDVHHTSKHKEKDPLPDQICVSRWCLEQQFFEPLNRPLPKTQKYESCKGDFVKDACRNVFDKGVKKLTQKDLFEQKMYKHFPKYRQMSSSLAQL